jgi:hypothetical protein
MDDYECGTRISYDIPIISCKRCKIKMVLLDSIDIGYCRDCRKQIVPNHIPKDQHKRYIERRYGQYETEIN